jgi:O-antigen/teichoic acid export membrane protein
MGMLLFPKLVQDQHNAWELTWQSLVGVGASMGFLCILAAVIAKPFILLLYGPAFQQSVAIFWSSLPGVFFLSLTGIVSQYLSARGFPWMQVVIWLFGFVLMASLAYSLIHRYALIGAALAISVDHALVFGMLCLLAWHCRKTERAENGAPAPVPVAQSFIDGQ